MGMGICLPTRLTDVKILRLRPALEHEIEKLVERYHIEWEAWIESAESYAALRKNLRSRGYTNTPTSDKDHCREQRMSQINEHVIEKLPNQKTMLRRKSLFRS